MRCDIRILECVVLSLLLQIKFYLRSNNINDCNNSNNNYSLIEFNFSKYVTVVTFSRALNEIVTT